MKVVLLAAAVCSVIITLASLRVGISTDQRRSAARVAAMIDVLIWRSTTSEVLTWQ